MKTIITMGTSKYLNMTNVQCVYEIVEINFMLDNSMISLTD